MTAAAEYPVDGFRDAAPLLRRPFTPKALRFKVQAQWPKNATPTGGLVVAYIDARLVIDRLNLIVPDLWHARYEPLGQGAMWCHLTIGDITRTDVGQGTGKGLVSDALKRAAVHFGIGVSLYAIPKMILNASSELAKVTGADKLEITPKGDLHLRDTYEHWLSAHGAAAYGEPLDHGDTGDSQGDPHEPEEVEEVAAEIVQPGLLPDPPPRRPIPGAPRAPKSKLDLIRVRARQASVDDERLAEILSSYGAETVEDLSARMADDLIDYLSTVAA